MKIKIKSRLQSIFDTILGYTIHAILLLLHIGFIHLVALGIKHL